MYVPGSNPKRGHKNRAGLLALSALCVSDQVCFFASFQSSLVRKRLSWVLRRPDRCWTLVFFKPLTDLGSVRGAFFLCLCAREPSQSCWVTKRLGFIESPLLRWLIAVWTSWNALSQSYPHGSVTWHSLLVQSSCAWKRTALFDNWVPGNSAHTCWGLERPTSPISYKNRFKLD